MADGLAYPDEDLWSAVTAAIDDAICDGEGRLYTSYMRHHVMLLPLPVRLRLARTIAPDHVMVPRDMARSALVTEGERG